MEIKVSNLQYGETQKIVTHVMLYDKNKAEEIAKTLEGIPSKERVVKVSAIFNGVEVDGQVIEDLLKERVRQYDESLKLKYSDVEAEISRRVEKIKKELEEQYRSEAIDKIESIRQTLDRIEVDLECL